MMKQTSTGLVSAVLLLTGLGCSNGNVRAAAPPPPPTVEVAPVLQKDVPLQGEWVGTLEFLPTRPEGAHLSGGPALLRPSAVEAGPQRARYRCCSPAQSAGAPHSLNPWMFASSYCPFNRVAEFLLQSRHWRA